MTKNTQQQTLFFSTEQSNISDVARVRYEDFLNGHEFLTSLHNVQPNKIDQILRSHLSYKRSVVPSTPNQEQQNRLVLTDTARENVSKILEVLDDPIPILLEGNTGVGKSASVLEAAHQSGRTLVRYNMSSRVTIDDLLGKVTLLFDGESQTTRLQFVNGPFTAAFSHGYWILFDELNLAQDTVLQAIESALDTHRLTIHNSSSSQQSGDRTLYAFRFSIICYTKFQHWFLQRQTREIVAIVSQSIPDHSSSKNYPIVNGMKSSNNVSHLLCLIKPKSWLNS